MKKEKLVDKISELSSIINDLDYQFKTVKKTVDELIDVFTELPTDIKEIEDDEDETKPED